MTGWIYCDLVELAFLLERLGIDDGYRVDLVAK